MLLRLATLLLVLLTACGSSGLDPRNRPETSDLLGILVTPEEIVVPQGGSVQLHATGLYEGRKTNDLTAVVTWRSDDDGIARPDGGLDAEGVFYAESVGSTRVSASVDGVQSPKVVLKVTDQQITALSVEPSELVLQNGQTVELEATATFSDGSRSDATGLVRWITDNGAIATLDAGLLTASGNGTTSIHAQYEDVRSNTVPVEVLAQASADLRIATLSASPYEDSITAVVEVENIGTAGASAFWVDGFIDFVGTPGPGDTGDAYKRVNWVGPGETVQVVLDLAGLSPGMYDVDVAVDTEDEIDEDNENNNHADTSVSVVGGGGTTSSTSTTPSLPADLVVDSVDFLSDGTWVYYEVEISNYGDVGAGPFWVDVYADRFSSPTVGDDGDDWVEVPWLGGWSSVVLDFLIEIDCDYGCDTWVFADSYDDIAEDYEADNLYGPVYVY